MFLDLGMQPNADAGDLIRIDHLESAGRVQNADQRLFRTTAVRGGYRMPVVNLDDAPVGPARLRTFRMGRAIGVGESGRSLWHFIPF